MFEKNSKILGYEIYCQSSGEKIFELNNDFNKQAYVTNDSYVFLKGHIPPKYWKESNSGKWVNKIKKLEKMIEKGRLRNFGPIDKIVEVLRD